MTKTISKLICYYTGKLNYRSNIVEIKRFSRHHSYPKIGHERRFFRLYAVFGGRSDDVTSKVS